MSSQKKLSDLSSVVGAFMKLRKADHRYASFDYCYNHFHPTNRKRKLDSEKSCAVLFSYLASWGMLRGSSFLLKETNIKHFEPTIQFINGCEPSCWEIDVDNYTVNNNANIDTILDMAEGIRKHIRPDEKISVTLVTKILLGVFGCVPAFDSMFRKTFDGFNSLSPKSLIQLNKICCDNAGEIDKQSQKYKTLVFQSGDTPNPYTKAKIIDMYGFYKTFSQR
ncbi:MAG: hypothetical protein ACRC46_00620 [Thermoguttaceae bacterium]